MHINDLPEYTEELPLHHLKEQQYFTAAHEAVKNIGWHPESVSGTTITCYTQAGNPSLGEFVTIHARDDKAIFTSRSVNEYYWSDRQNKINADFFKQAVTAVIEENRKIEKKANPLTREKYGAMLPSRTYLVTPVLLYINVIVFLCMTLAGISPITPAVPALLAWGGNFRSSVIAGEWWRLFTHMFLHGGILHLFMNMYALLYIGMMLEPLMGKFRFIAAYILTGICGGLLSIALHSYSVGVGASGAIFGLYGVFLAMLTTKHIEKTARNTMLKSILFFVVFNLIYGIQGNIDNAAHIGGLVSGFIIGYIYYPGIAKFHELKKQLTTTALIAITVLLVSAITVSQLTDDLSIYQQKINKFSAQETRALAVFDKRSDSDALHYIRDSGIYYWNDNIGILNELQQLDLPASLTTRNTRLLEYCQARIKQYELLYEQMSGEADSDSYEIKESQAAITQILNELRKQ